MSDSKAEEQRVDPEIAAKAQSPLSKSGAGVLKAISASPKHQTDMKSAYANLNEDGSISIHGMRRWPAEPLILPGRGPHILEASDGQRAYCGGPGMCPACDAAEGRGQEVAKAAQIPISKIVTVNVTLTKEQCESQASMNQVLAWERVGQKYEVKP